jgi:hypothetical protein
MIHDLVLSLRREKMAGEEAHGARLNVVKCGGPRALYARPVRDSSTRWQITTGVHGEVLGPHAMHALHLDRHSADIACKEAKGNVCAGVAQEVLAAALAP